MGKLAVDVWEELACLRARLDNGTLREGGWERVLESDIRINDGPNLCVLFKDIFCHRIYDFESDRADPFILDCGSNIGLSILYFKHVWPGARIVAFEPDPSVLPYLKDNLQRNGWSDVELVEAALCGGGGQRVLHSDGKYGSRLSDYGAGDRPEASAAYDVRCVRLRDYLGEPVDFLKMNIEGAEWEVLADSEDRLRRVRAMVIEYHHLPGLPRTLHKILELLDRQGFEYLVHDFDAETNPGSKPPFRIGPSRRYYLLIYAQRTDHTGS